MSYTLRTMPGPGDPETWGAPTGHPHDPRHLLDVECPGCDGPADEHGCADDDDCGYRWPEPDYEAMIDDGGPW